MSIDIKKWISYIQDIKFKVLFMFTMILLPLREVMVPQREIDPGPCPPSISLVIKLKIILEVRNFYIIRDLIGGRL